MGPSDLPHLTIADVFADCCTGLYDPSPWVGEGWIGGIFLEGARFIWGRFRDVDATARRCSFYPDRAAELSALKSGGQYPFIDAYWGERAELVLDEGRRWQRTHFEPSDMVSFPLEDGSWLGRRSSPEAPSGGELVPGAWDHEHCRICQEKIGCGGVPDGFLSPPDAWVCEECYAGFVAPRSLAFISIANHGRVDSY